MATHTREVVAQAESDELSGRVVDGGDTHTATAQASPTSRACGSPQPVEPELEEEEEKGDGYILLRMPWPRAVVAKRILCLSDTHDQHMFMPADLPVADILVHAGDFTVRGSKEELDNFCTWTDDLLARGVVRDIVFICGNHEISLELVAKRLAVRRNQEAMKRMVVDRPHIHYLEDCACEVQGIKFYGSPWCTRFGRDWAFQLADTPQELGSKYSLIPEGVDVLVTHQPPLGHGDRNECDKRTGSCVLLERVTAVAPLLHVFGHIHTGHGVTRHEGLPTQFINAAICDEDYKPIQKPFLVELVQDGEDITSM